MMISQWRPRTTTALGLTITILLAASAGPAVGGESAAKERSFFLGLTPFPYDVTMEAVETTYELVTAHSDIIAHHFDSGVPWSEALRRTPYHPNVQQGLDERLVHTPDTHRVYLAVTPISGLRDGLAGSWGEAENMKRAGPWRNRGFGHPKVIRAYINHCRFMIDTLQPDFLAYGIEVDLLAQNDPEGFQEFTKLARKTYRKLKRQYPQLPIFLTFTVPDLAAFEERRPIIEQLLPYTDFMAISTYPYLAGIFKPAELPPEWFSRMRDLAPDKPFAVAETGFIAEDLVFETLGITIPGKPKWQAAYMSRLLRHSNRLDAQFVIWFVAVDYDRAWARIQGTGINELFKAWRDTGLWNENLEPRRAQKIWKQWLRRNLSPP